VRRLVFPFLLCLAIACSSRRDTGASANPRPDTVDKAMRQAVNSFSGHWDIDFTIKPNAALPKGGKGRGTELWKAGPGGLSLIEEYHSSGDDGDSSGHGIFWFDQSLQRFQVLWCANDVPTGCMLLSEGAVWNNDQLVLQHRWTSEGRQRMLREVFSDITPSSFTQTVYAGNAEASLEIEYVIRARKR
jgi:hypothetical protein